MAELQDKQGQQYQGLESSLKVVMQQVQKDSAQLTTVAKNYNDLTEEIQDVRLTGKNLLNKYIDLSVNLKALQGSSAQQQDL